MFQAIRHKGFEIAEWEMRELGEFAEGDEYGEEVGVGESAAAESGVPAWEPADALGLKANGRRRDEDDEEDEDVDFAFDELDEDEELDEEEEDLDDYEDEDDLDEDDFEDEE